MTTTVVTAKRWLRVLSAGVVALVVICGIGFKRLESVTNQLQRNSDQDCQTRKEGRDALRDTLIDLALTRPDPSDPTGQHRIVVPRGANQTTDRIYARIDPGGPLEPITC